VPRLAQNVLERIRRQELLKPGDRVGVAVSGGADSVGLLRLLLELRPEVGIVLAVVHFNHTLRGAESDADEQFVAALAREHHLDFLLGRADVRGHAAAQQLSLEAAARQLRYEFFRSRMRDAPGKGGLTRIATGHTLDDQAETVLMRLIRGTGTRGLAGIHSRLVVGQAEGDEASGEIIRPLLGVRHQELEQYLRCLSQSWREDSTNRDAHFTRNRVRQVLVPLLEKEFNPAVVARMAELAEIAREEEDYWDNEASGWMGTGVHWTEPEWSARSGARGLVELKPLPPDGARPRTEPGPQPVNASVDLAWFLSEPAAVQRRILRVLASVAKLPLEFRHVEEIRELAAQEQASGKYLALPLGWKLIREPEALVLQTPDLRVAEQVSESYEYSLPLPGRAMVPQAGIVVEAVQVVCGSGPEGHDPDRVLNPSLLAPELKVRNWRPGDRFWPAHTKSPRKVKELLQERHLTRQQRKLWPVAVSGEEIVWLRGFPVPARLGARGGSGILIRDLVLEE